MEINCIAALHRQFNETIDKWIGYPDSYTLEMLCRKPAADSWSLGQVYVHIIDDTKYFTGQMEAALTSDANSEKTMHEDAQAMFARNEFPGIQLTGPATNDNVRQPESKEELPEGLIFIKNEVNRLFTTFDSSQSKGKTEHPGLLFFNAQEWLQFAEMHMRHHFRQKKRIDEKIFPV